MKGKEKVSDINTLHSASSLRLNKRFTRSPNNERRQSKSPMPDSPSLSKFYVKNVLAS